MSTAHLKEHLEESINKCRTAYFVGEEHADKLGEPHTWIAGNVPVYAKECSRCEANTQTVVSRSYVCTVCGFTDSRLGVEGQFEETVTCTLCGCAAVLKKEGS